MKIRINRACRKRRQDRRSGMGRCLCIEPKRLIQLQEEEYELQANVIDDAHDLGFVEGVRYALNIMDMTDAGKNKELLKRLLNILEK